MYRFCFNAKNVRECDNFIEALEKCANAHVVEWDYDMMTDSYEVKVEFTCEYCMND